MVVYRMVPNFEPKYYSALAANCQRSSSETCVVDSALMKRLPFPYFHNYLPNAYVYPSNVSSREKPVLAFVHNPKSGGTTVKNCMLKIFQPNPPVVLSFKTAYTIRENLLNSDVHLDDYYMGDSALGICDYETSRPCSYFTMMREPYDRVVSHYYFCKDGGQSYPPCDNSLEDFVLDSCSLFFRQTTVRFNCKEYFDHYCDDKLMCPQSWHCNATEVHVDNMDITQHERETILQYVIQNLDKMFTVIGLMEEFDTSLELYQDALGGNFHEFCQGMYANKGSYFHRENEGGGKTLSREDEVEAAKRRLRSNENVRRCLSDDEKIYEKAKELFEIQKKELEKRKKAQKGTKAS